MRALDELRLLQEVVVGWKYQNQPTAKDAQNAKEKINIFAKAADAIYLAANYVAGITGSLQPQLDSRKQFHLPDSTQMTSMAGRMLSFAGMMAEEWGLPAPKHISRHPSSVRSTQDTKKLYSHYDHAEASMEHAVAILSKLRDRMDHKRFLRPAKLVLSRMKTSPLATRSL